MIKPMNRNLRLWLAARFLMHQGADQAGQGRMAWVRQLGLPAWLSFTGLAFGVACLTVSMAVVSGFETTLKNSLIDVFGHLLVVKRADRIGDGEIESLESASEKIRKALPEAIGITPFINFEAIIVGKNKLNGVVVQGIDLKSKDFNVEKVLELRPRVIRGEFAVGPSQAMVGKALAERFDLNIGSEFKAVLPRPSGGRFRC